MTPGVQVARDRDLDNRFAYHAPPTPERIEAHALIRRTCRMMANDIVAMVPDGREQALAITHLEEVMFWANAGIARQGGA